MPRFRPPAAFLVSLLSFLFLAAISNRFAYGDYFEEGDTLAWEPVRRWQEFMANRGLAQLGYATSDALVYSPAFVIGLLAYTLLRRKKADGYAHCAKCDHILKGLTAPRCPECGATV